MAGAGAHAISLGSRAAPADGAYARHRVEETVLYRLLAEHRRSFLAATEAEDGSGAAFRAPWSTTAPGATIAGRRCATVEGFSLHANVRVAANDRDGLEHLARYLARPPIAVQRLTRLPDGRVVLRFKRPFSDGTEAASSHRSS